MGALAGSGRLWPLFTRTVPLAPGAGSSLRSPGERQGCSNQGRGAGGGRVQVPETSGGGERPGPTLDPVQARTWQCRTCVHLITDLQNARSKNGWSCKERDPCAVIIRSPTPLSNRWAERQGRVGDRRGRGGLEPPLGQCGLMGMFQAAALRPGVLSGGMYEVSEGREVTWGGGAVRIQKPPAGRVCCRKPGDGSA